MSEPASEIVMGALVTVALLALYFLPMIIAIRLNHRNTTAIGLLNLFLGWTFVGWVVAMVWACYVEKGQVPIDAPPIMREPVLPPPPPPPLPRVGTPKVEPLGSVPESWQN